MRMIQEGEQGHDSVEDALATMELFQLIKRKWEARCPDLAGADLFADEFWEEEENRAVNHNHEVFSEEYI